MHTKLLEGKKLLNTFIDGRLSRRMLRTLMNENPQKKRDVLRDPTQATQSPSDENKIINSTVLKSGDDVETGVLQPLEMTSLIQPHRPL